MSKFISRSTFLKGTLAAGLAGVGAKLYFDAKDYASRIPCRFLGPSRELGHTIRSGIVAVKDAPVIEKKVLIIGGGIAGLSAAWWLKRNGFHDFSIMELEKEVGGNSSSGSNQISQYPWGAHYVPLANEESAYVKSIFQEFGIITGYDGAGLPIYNELYLCHDPQERLLKDGTFQDGLVPKRGLQKNDQEEMERFFSLIADLRAAKGKDEKPAFAIPLELSSEDFRFRSLDTMSMADWLKANNFKSRPLHWYINYCCKDDYGATCDSVSAWAGLHYFAGRRGKAANAENNSVVTWPEGNGFLVRKLKDQLQQHIVSSAMVYSISQNDEHVFASYLNVSDKTKLLAKSEKLLLCAPRFIAKHLLAGDKLFEANEVSPSLTYSPWLVANLSLKKLPRSRGEGMAWDNVSYYSDSLGYVVATHQNISTREGASVITYYYPLSKDGAHLERAHLQKAESSDWIKIITSDLERMHPGISADIISIDLWPWGHGMIRPSVGYLWGIDRQKMKLDCGRVSFAHSDMSGISNFEEAQFQGVEAAKKILAEQSKA